MKTLKFLCCITLFMLFPMTANAQSATPTLTDTHIEIIDAGTADIRVIGHEMSVTREFTFSGIIAPPSTRAHTEFYNGALYSGTLTLSRFYIENGNTVAVYKGTLIAET